MFWKRRRSDADFNEEIRSHIEIETEQLISEGSLRPTRELQRVEDSVM